MDGDSTDEEDFTQGQRAFESSSESESERSPTRSRGRSRGRSRVWSRGSPRPSSSSGESQSDLQHESTKQPKDRSRGRSRVRPRPGSGSVTPRRARSMSRPPSMERVHDFSFELRSRSLSRSRVSKRSRSMEPRSRGRSRVRSRGSPRPSSSSSESQSELQHESTKKSKDRSRGRSRVRPRPGSGSVTPRRARSMSRPPSMERVRDFSCELRSRSLSRSRVSRRSCFRARSPSVEHPLPHFSELRVSPGPNSVSMRSSTNPQHLQRLRDSPGPGSDCAVCGNVTKDPVSSGCGHSLCRDCLWSLDEPGGAHLCPQCNQTPQISATLLSGYKLSLEERYDSVSEGLETGTRSLNSFYTKLSITEDLSEEDRTRDEEKTVHDLFQPSSSDRSPVDQRHVKVVLTRGDAGMGKTVSVQKFSQDWARGLVNQDLELVLPLSFRELNLVRRGRYSLLELIQELHPSLKGLTVEELAHSKVLFIFDGLDESRLPLNFSCEVISEVTQRSEVATLLVNLIKGHLLPDALIWITSRPVAANQIPVQYVDRFTKISGFSSDQQREQFFRRRFRDEEQCERVLSFIKTSHSLWSMCQNPVFCWTTATVLEQSSSPSLTELFVTFLLVQMHRKKRKYEHVSDFQVTAAEHELLLKLGRLAFQLLDKLNNVFDQEDLRREGLDLTTALVYSGLCTEVLKQHSVIFNQSEYSFVHPSVQGVLAAVYIHHSLNQQSTEELKRFKLLPGQNTLLFLHELTLKQNQKLLSALLHPQEHTEQRAID